MIDKSTGFFSQLKLQIRLQRHDQGDDRQAHEHDPEYHAKVGIGDPMVQADGD